MAKKKQPPEERRPDLAAPDQDAVEARVRNMLDIEVSDDDEKQTVEPEEVVADEPSDPDKDLKPKKVEVQEVSSAPVLPSEEPEEVEEPENESVEEEKDDETDDVPDEEDALENEQPEEKLLNLDEAPTDEAIIEEPVLEESETSEEPEETEDLSDTKEDEDDAPIKKTDVDSVIDDSKTAKVVDEIIAKEADELLEIEDEKVLKSSDQPKKSGIKQKIVGAVKAWWNNPRARWLTIAGLALFIAIIFIIPTSRYFMLNSVGFRGNATITVLDESTGQPLKNVDVIIANSMSKTDTNGLANLSKVRLGANELVVKKRAFAVYTQKITVKMGNNTPPKVSLKPTGEQFSFVVKDYLTGKPIVKAEAISGEASAISDEQGKIKLTVDGTQDKEKLEVTFKKEDYREDKVSINPDDKSEQPIVMVPSRRHVFVSKRTGTYDVYGIDVDGKNEKKLLTGTGSERDDIALSIHQTAAVAAVVSTSSGKTNGDGFLLSTLKLVDDQSGKSKDVTTSEKVQVIDWVGDSLIYVQATAGASAGNPKRHRLMSYNYKTAQNDELATGNYFNDVVVADGKIYYAPSGSYNATDAKLYRVNADGSQKTTIANQEVWNIFRTDYDNLVLSANRTWLNLRIGEDKTTSISTQPTNPKSRIYVTSKDGKNSLWVDQRDGKGVLVNYEVSSRNEPILKSENGLGYPVYWLNNRTVIYRVSNEQQTTDYVISLDGGEAKKVADVTNTNSINNWYYY